MEEGQVRWNKSDRDKRHRVSLLLVVSMTVMEIIFIQNIYNNRRRRVLLVGMYFFIYIFYYCI